MALCALALGLGGLVTASPAVAAPSNTLGAGATLNAGDTLFSAAGTNWAAMQADGNFTLNGPRGPLWQTGTGGTGANRIVMQTDGNLVIYTAQGVPVWQSGTSGNEGASLQLTDLGQLRILSAGSIPIWTTRGLTGRSPSTLRPGEQLLRGQALVANKAVDRANFGLDGNFTATIGLSVTWSAGTAGAGGAKLVMQTDGNLVMYTPTGRAVWFSGTGGNPGASFSANPDGSISIRSASGQVLWAQVTSAGPAGDRIATIARSQDQLHKKVQETPMGSNCDPYTASWGRGVTGGCPAGTAAEAWCSDFAQWVWQGAGMQTTGITGWSYTFVTWGQAHGTFRAGPTASPKVGDAVVWGSMAQQYGQHVGLVVAVQGSKIEVVSGNSGDAVQDSGFFDPSTSSIGGYPIVGYSSPLAVTSAAPHALSLPTVQVPLSLINTQDGGH
jgi:hypothetical protein